MKLTFLGTRGYIEERNRRHRRHSAALIEYKRRRIMIDCGEDWLGAIDEIDPNAIVLTHAHPDHAHGLKDGAPCPVWATERTWESIADYPIEKRRTYEDGERVEVEGVSFTPFSVEHSIRCPAVGLRVEAGAATVFYAPDVVFIHERSQALRGAQLYVGDGATLGRSMVRQRDARLVDHTPVRTQLTWCEKEGVPEMIVTHCGAEIVTGDERTLGARVRGWGRERGVRVSIAHDSATRVLS